MNNNSGSSSAQTSVSAAQLAKGSIYRLPGNAEIGSVTVDASQFVGTITVYNGTQAGNPMFQVASGQVKTMPVGAARSLFLQSAIQGTGIIYLQYTDQFLSSTTNLSQSAPVASQSWTICTQGQVDVVGALHGTITDPIFGTLAYIELNNTNQNVQNGKGTFPTISLQSLEVSGLPPYVSSGVNFSTGALPAGISTLLVGNGRWEPANPLLAGTYTPVSPYAWAVFGNYDNVNQIFGRALCFTLSGFST